MKDRTLQAELWQDAPPYTDAQPPGSDRSRFSDHSMVSPVMRRTQREKRERYINPKHPMPKGYDKADIYPSTILERDDYQEACDVVQNYLVMEAMRRAPLARSSEDIAIIMAFLYEVWPKTRELGGECTRRVARMACLRKFAQRQLVVREGDVGATFYIVVNGEAAVIKGGLLTGEHELRGGTKVASLRVGDSFGEAALDEGASPRNATVMATSEFLELLELRKTEYDELLKTYREGEVRRAYFLLRNTPLFMTWAKRRVQRICQLVRRLEIKKGTVIVTQGDVAHDIFFILDGECAVVKDVVRQGINRWPTSINTWETVGRSSHELVPQKPIKKGECFGELAFANRGLRTATVSAVTDCTLLALDKVEFERVISDGRTGGRRLTVAQRVLQPNDEELNNMLRSIKGEGPIRLVPSIRLSEEDSVREAELASMSSKDPLYKFEKILEKKRLKELEPEKLISPVRRPRVRRPVTASASVDTRCRRRKNGSARNVSGNPSVFSAPAAIWDDPRGRRPSTAGADFMDMSLIRGMARGDHLNRRRRFAVTSYEKGAALEI